jgi:hypothetical protein
MQNGSACRTAKFAVTFFAALHFLLVRRTIAVRIAPQAGKKGGWPADGVAA